MRILPFILNGQKLSKNGDFSHIIRGTKGYLKCEFDFKGIDWIGYNRICVFNFKNKEYAKKISSNNMCMIPDEITDEKYFKIKVVGIKGDDVIYSTTELIEQEG